eukprot:5820902-Prymnesium_polylepis.1
MLSVSRICTGAKPAGLLVEGRVTCATSRSRCTTRSLGGSRRQSMRSPSPPPHSPMYPSAMRP